MKLSDFATLVYIGMAATALLCMFTRVLIFWRVKADWQMLTFAGMNASQFVLYALLIYERNPTTPRVIFAWSAVWFFFALSTVGYLVQIIQVERIRRHAAATLYELTGERENL